MTPNLGVFLCTCLEKLKGKYSYGKLLNKERLTNEKIQLPVNKSGDLDFEAMEEFMQSVSSSFYNIIKEEYGEHK